jgi:hypothetical protein
MLWPPFWVSKKMLIERWLEMWDDFAGLLAFFQITQSSSKKNSQNIHHSK